MKCGILILCMSSVLLLFGLTASARGQSNISETPQLDSIDIVVIYQTVYPGTDSAWLEVWMDNPEDTVAGFQFMFTLSSNVVGFCEGEAGSCIVDTTGGIAGVLGPLNCWGGGVGVQVTSSPSSPPYIEPYAGGHQLLFKLCMYSCCIPDTSSERSATVFLAPASSFISDEDGQLIPFRYQPGEVTLWWSVPGDANGDSVVGVDDIVFMLNYLYRGGPEPCVCEAADSNGDGIMDLGDLVYLLNYLFKEGNSPFPGSAHCPHEGCRPE